MHYDIIYTSANMGGKNYKMGKKKHVFTYICEDCIFVFQTFAHVGKYTFCPKCGENTSTHRYENSTGNRRVYMPFTDEELPTLEKVIKGEILPYQGAILLGRTVDSIKKKVSRMKKSIT